MANEMMNVIIIFIISIYVLLAILMFVGLHCGTKGKNKKLHNFSIVVAIKNEAPIIENLLKSLIKIDYPKEMLEIIIVDNGSNDNTGDIVSKFCEKYDYFTFIKAENKSNNKLKGKSYALQQGILKSKGEIILVADGDCKVPPSWVRSYNSKFDKKIGLIAGNLSLIEKNRKASLFVKIQALDWIFLQSIAAGTTGINLPVSMIGGNFAIRRETYNDIGGFEKLGFSIIEDMQIIQAVAKNKKWKVLYSSDNDLLVDTLPPVKFSEFIKQRKRWVMGSTDVSVWGIFLQITAVTNHLLIIFGFLMPVSKLLLLGGILSIFSVDFILLFRQLARFKMKRLLFYFFHFELFYIFYTFIFLPVVLFSKKVEWKGEEYKV